MYMEKNEKSYLKEIIGSMVGQISLSAPISHQMSWGIEKVYAQYYPHHGHPSPTLVMKVNGFNYKGIVRVVYNEGTDLYDILTNGDVIEDVYCDVLGNVLDKLIEKGDMSEEEYRKRVEQTYKVIEI